MKREGCTLSSNFVSERHITSMSLSEEKIESSSSRQRDVIEFMFTCEMVMLWVLCPPGELDDVDGCDVEAAELTEAVRCPEPGEGIGVLIRCWRRSSGCTLTY